MHKVVSLVAALVVVLCSNAPPSFAKDNGVDVYDVCHAALMLCQSTCDLKWAGPGFSADLGRGLCHDDCVSQFHTCVATGDGDGIMRQDGRSKGAVEKLTRQSLPKLSY
jgi:hypothetical protein